MVRDRLYEMKKLTRDFQKLCKYEDVIEIENGPLKNVLNLVEKIEEEIQSISENVMQCRSYIKQILDLPFKEKELSIKLTELFQVNGTHTRNINSYLKQFENHIKNTDKRCTIGRIEIIQFNTLRTRFRECLKDNNEEMENFRNFRINTYKAQLKAKGMQVTDDDLVELLNGDQEIQIFTNNHLIEVSEARRLLSEAEELNGQLLKIESLIRDIRDLFVQMSVLVEEQQELIDVVEYQAQQAVEYVSKTPGILQEAEEKKRKAAKMKYLCCGIIILIIVIIAISFIYS